MKFVFLYTELADYVIHCLKRLADENNEVHVVKWEVNSEAPFEFKVAEGVKLYNRSDYTDKKSILGLMDVIKPDMIICSGWTDKLYLYVSGVFNGKIPTVLTLDNHWTGSLKQLIARAMSPFFLKTKFSHVWVPGNKQYEYAIQLGFSPSNIEKNFYSANVELFTNFHVQNLEKKSIKFPHVFLYVGRYVEHKGIFDMWKAFLELNDELNTDWELWCVGAGDQFDNRIKHSKIRHFGFLQPNKMNEVISNAGVYILPSHFEPWGVTLQEFTAAGLPILCSDKVGSSEIFLEEGVNGYSFRSEDVQEIKECMYRIINMNDKSLAEFQKQSSIIGKKINSDLWVETIMKFNNA
ncbi:MAG: glycosyltransferase family 4 protein [Flavobacteriales bacterium]|nr:glycosyltransferase family 4 protein [Flavobacteriales bacterium]